MSTGIQVDLIPLINRNEDDAAVDMNFRTVETVPDMK
jgi:hypothetical protein